MIIMKKTTKLFLLWLWLVIFIFSCTSSLKETEPKIFDYKVIVEELQVRKFDVEVNTYKGLKSYVSANPNTTIIEGDLDKICKLPNLSQININSENLPISFFDNIQKCELSNLGLLNLRNLNFKEGLICNFNRVKREDFYFHLSNTNVSDIDLACIAQFQPFQQLSFSGPQQKFSDESFCSLCKSGVWVKSLHLKNLHLSDKAYNCLSDLKGIETFGFKKIKGRSASDMKKLEDLYFKKNGRKVFVDVFEYDKL
jgi:hypothetical protein